MEVLPLLRRTFSTYAPAERQKLLALIRQKPAEATEKLIKEEGYAEDRAALISPLARQLLGL